MIIHLASIKNFNLKNIQYLYSRYRVFLNHLRAYLLMYGLFKLLVVKNSPDLSIRVDRPVWGHNLYLAFTYIQPDTKLMRLNHFYQ